MDHLRLPPLAVTLKDHEEKFCDSSYTGKERFEYGYLERLLMKTFNGATAEVESDEMVALTAASVDAGSDHASIMWAVDVGGPP